ncbi:GD20300 [Drosophila simulans]|uniref:GD20300 n=1 Tax=Drosophila simulans TaxID=7240 RepID=B4QX56_DROSI|nr:GD20300 [Drosophila simulans]
MCLTQVSGRCLADSARNKRKMGTRWREGPHAWNPVKDEEAERRGGSPTPNDFTFLLQVKSLKTEECERERVREKEGEGRSRYRYQKGRQNKLWKKVINNSKNQFMLPVYKQAAPKQQKKQQQ